MPRPRLEVADVFHRHGADWRKANAGHLSLGQLQVMSAIEQCRSAALTKAIELEFIKSIVTNKGVIEAQQLTNLHLYRNWLQDLWKQLCGNAINIVYERNSCTIEDGLQEIKPALESK